MKYINGKDQPLNLRTQVALGAGRFTLLGSWRLYKGGSSMPGKVAHANDPNILKSLAEITMSSSSAEQTGKL